MSGRDPVPTIDPAGDPRLLLERLAAGIARALPAGSSDGMLQLDRDRSLADRFAGRPGTPVLLRVSTAVQTLTLRIDARRGGPTGEIARVSGGVVIARRTVPVGAWLAALEEEVASLAADAAADGAAAGRALAALGLHPPVDDLVVDGADPARGLLAFQARARTAVPSDAAELVDRLVVLLRETLPRVDGDAAGLVRRTATVYLPDTVRAYAALPSDWARSHTLPDGGTPAAALVAQLTDLVTATERMREAAVADDVAALLLNGLFLSDRFG